jgi:hypothetical protein
MPVFDIKQGFDSGYSDTPFCTQTFSLLIQITGSFPFWYQLFHISSSLLYCCQTLNRFYPIVWFMTL